MGPRVLAMGRASVRDRAVRELVARCHVGLDSMALHHEVVHRLRLLLSLDAVFCAGVDPATLLFTSAVLEEIPPESTPRFLANEFLEDDVNKFRTLAHRRFPVDWLDHATGANRPASPRYREIMAPIGLGDELRAAFRSGGECWGFLCLHREDGALGFSEAEARLIGRLAPHVGEGLRRALLVGAASTSPEAEGPGVLVVDADRSLMATTEAGERWLWELAGPDQGLLPLAVETVLARLEAIQRARARSTYCLEFACGPGQAVGWSFMPLRWPGSGQVGTLPWWSSRQSPQSSPLSFLSPTGSRRGKLKSPSWHSKVSPTRCWRESCASRRTPSKITSRPSLPRSALGAEAN